MSAFLNGTLEVSFCTPADDCQRYAFISTVLERFAYARLQRADRGVVRRYLERTTGYSRAQLTRLVQRWLDDPRLAKRYRSPVSGFSRKFTPADVSLLAETDTLHGTLSGPATRCLMQRAWSLYTEMPVTPAPWTARLRSHKSWLHQGAIICASITTEQSGTYIVTRSRRHHRRSDSTEAWSSIPRSNNVEQKGGGATTTIDDAGDY